MSESTGIELSYATEEIQEAAHVLLAADDFGVLLDWVAPQTPCDMKETQLQIGSRTRLSWDATRKLHGMLGLAIARQSGHIDQKSGGSRSAAASVNDRAPVETLEVSVIDV